MKKTILALVLCVALILPVEAAGYTKSFSDVNPNDWFYTAVMEMAEAGIVNGRNATRFAPDEPITYAEFITIAVRLAVTQDEAALIASSSTGAKWYSNYVDKAQQLGLIQTGEFSGVLEGPILREDMAYLVVQVHRLRGGTLPTPTNAGSIPDLSTVSENRKSSVATAYALKLIEGRSNGNFAPKDGASRAEGATVFNRILNGGSETVSSVAPDISSAEVFATFDSSFVVDRKMVTDMLTTYIFPVYADLDWTQDYGVGDLGEFLTAMALDFIASDYSVLKLAAMVGVEVDSYEQAYQLAEQLVTQDVMRAKHILFSTLDQNEQPVSAEERAGKLKQAELMYDMLLSTPEIEVFDSIMNTVSEDPGLASFPDGYIFGQGQMIEVFENAVMALPIGGVSNIVESEFGFHIILRLDPQEDAEAFAQYVQEGVRETLNEIMSYVTVVHGDAYDNFDCEALFHEWAAR